MFRINCLLVCLFVVAGNSIADEGVPPTPQLTKEHKFLQRNLGVRSGTMQMYSEPGAAPLEMPFKETNTAVHGGLWVQSEFEVGPYQGRGMTGFDPIRKKFVGTWTNNQTPYLAVMEGTYDETTHELVMTFRDYDMAAGKIVDHKSVGVHAPDKPETFTMFRKNDAGAWVKIFSMTYNRPAAE